MAIEEKSKKQKEHKIRRQGKSEQVDLREGFPEEVIFEVFDVE